MRGPTPRRKKEFSVRLNQRARDVEPSHQWPSPQSGEPATNPQSAPRTLPPPQAVPGNIREHFEVRFRTTYETFHSAQHAISVFHSTHHPHTSFPFQTYVSPIAESQIMIRFNYFGF